MFLQRCALRSGSNCTGFANSMQSTIRDVLSSFCFQIDISATVLGQLLCDSNKKCVISVVDAC